MPNPTYANLITPQEVSLALEHLLIAPYGTAWTPGRVTVDAPPTGFIHLGAVEDGSPQISINKEAYSFSTGIPSALAYQAITGMSGSIAMTLHTFDAYGAHLASGGLPPVLQANTASNKTWLMLNSPQTRTTLVVSLGASAAPIRVNDMVVTDTTDMVTARSETNAEPGALPSVKPGTIKDDLFRRDFTRNAMAVSLEPASFGELVDPYGGKSDLDKGLIRILHKA